MKTRQLEAEMFGRSVSFNYSEAWVGYSLLSLRLIMGWVFFYAGISKVINPDWTVRSFLNFGISQDNFLRSLAGVDVWSVMASGEILDLGVYWYQLLTPLNQLGLTLIGLALIFGVLLRFSAFWGGVMMTFYWLASFPLTDAVVIDFHLVYVLLLFGIGAFGAGRLFGLDAWLEELAIVKENQWLQLFLG